MHRSPSRSLRLATALAVLALAGCGSTPGAAPLADSTAGSAPAGASGEAQAGGATDTSPASNLPSQAASPAGVQPLSVGARQSLAFQTKPGAGLTMIASAAASSETGAGYDLSVSPFQLAASGATTAMRKLTSLSASHPLPYSPGFLDASHALARQLPAIRWPSLHLLAQPTTRQVGSTDTFWVNAGSFSNAGDHQQTCTLMRVTPHAYFYVDQAAAPITSNHLDALAAAWESQIYPRVTQAFGQPSPSPNGDQHVYVVLSPAVDDFGAQPGLMGYFWGRDLMPPSESVTDSNQKAVVFMTDQLFNYQQLTSFGTLAHEFQHLINFSNKAMRTNYRVIEDTWLDEGMAMNAMEIAGYGMPAGDSSIASAVSDFESNPLAYSLTDWAHDPDHMAYGQSYLFVRYLIDRFGVGILKEIIGADTAGVDGLREVLAKHQTTFETVFRDWTIANLISGTPAAANTPYQYAKIDPKGLYGGIQLPGMQLQDASQATLNGTLPPWGSIYYTFGNTGSQPFKIDLQAAGDAPLLGAAVVP